MCRLQSPLRHIYDKTDMTGLAEGMEENRRKEIHPSLQLLLTNAVKMITYSGIAVSSSSNYHQVNELNVSTIIIAVYAVNPLKNKCTQHSQTQQSAAWAYLFCFLHS